MAPARRTRHDAAADPGAAGTLILLREARWRSCSGRCCSTGWAPAGWRPAGWWRATRDSGWSSTTFPTWCGSIRRLLVPDPGATLVRHPDEVAGFEDVAHDPETGRLFAVIEAELRHPDETWTARVWEFDAQLRPLRSRWLDRPLPSGNKGIEGLGYLRRGGAEYLLALSEGNFDAAGGAGRQGGGGRVHVFAERDGQSWAEVATVALPATLDAGDYSALSVRGDQLAVLSQVSALLWVGRLHPSSWDIMDGGRTYRLPLDPQGRTVYGTAEGVTWLDENTVAIVSDRARRDQPDWMRVKQESVHVFRLP